MVGGNSIKAKPIKANIVRPIILENRYENINGYYDGITETYYNYLRNGYTPVFYDVIVMGSDIDLTGYATGKYIVVFETGVYNQPRNITVAKTMTSSTAALHTDVIVMGIKLNDTPNFKDFDETQDKRMLINFTNADDFGGLLTLYFCDLYIDNTVAFTVKAINIYNSIIRDYDSVGLPGTSVVATFENCVLKNSSFITHGKTTTAGLIFKYTTNADVLIDNCVFWTQYDFNSAYQGYIKILSYTNSTVVLTLKNVMFYNDSGITTNYMQLLGYNAAGTAYPTTTTVSFISTMISNIKHTFANYSSNNSNNVVYGYNSGILDPAPNNIIVKIIENPETPYAVSIGVPYIDYDELDFTNFENLNADITVQYTPDTRIGSKVLMKTYYNLNFSDTQINKDTQKKFSRDYLLVVSRDDFDVDLIGKKIINMELFESDGTTEYDYQNDENFLIYAKNTVGFGTPKVTFAFIDNKLSTTILSDTFNDTTYTIQNVFQVMEIVNNQGVKNLHSFRPTYTPVVDSPLLGSLLLNNWDNEVV